MSPVLPRTQSRSDQARPSLLSCSSRKVPPSAAPWSGVSEQARPLHRPRAVAAEGVHGPEDGRGGDAGRVSERGAVRVPPVGRQGQVIDRVGREGGPLPGELRLHLGVGDLRRRGLEPQAVKEGRPLAREGLAEALADQRPLRHGEHRGELVAGERHEEDDPRPSLTDRAQRLLDADVRPAERRRPADEQRVVRRVAAHRIGLEQAPGRLDTASRSRSPVLRRSGRIVSSHLSPVFGYGGEAYVTASARWSGSIPWAG